MSSWRGSSKENRGKNAIHKKLQEEEAYIAKLRQQISSQEDKIKLQGENLPEKSDLLNRLAVSTDELNQALEEQREDEMKMEAYESEALDHQKHSEELQSTQFTVCIYITLLHTWNT